MVTVLSAADRVVRGVETTAIQWLRATAIHTEPTGRENKAIVPRSKVKTG